MKVLTRGLLLVIFSVMLSGCALLGNQNDDSNSEQQEPTSSDSDLSGSIEDDSAEDAESFSVSGDVSIVSLMPSNTEILDALGFTDSITAVSTVDTYPEALVEDPEVAQIDAFQFDAEQLLELEPTHIFSHETTQEMHEPVLDVISEETGAEVIYVKDAEDIEGIYETITDIGSVLGASDTADEVNDALQSRIEAVTEETSGGDDPPTVFIQISPYPEVFTAGSHTFMNDVIESVGAENAFSDIEGFSEISAEELMERNPDYVASVIDGYDAGMLSENVSDFTESSHLSITDPDRQCALDADLLSRPGPRIDEGMESLAQCLYE